MEDCSRTVLAISLQMKDNQRLIRDGDSFEEHLAGSDKTALIITEKLYFERNLTMRHDFSMKICNARWKT